MIMSLGLVGKGGSRGDDDDEEEEDGVERSNDDVAGAGFGDEKPETAGTNSAKRKSKRPIEVLMLIFH